MVSSFKSVRWTGVRTKTDQYSAGPWAVGRCIGYMVWIGGEYRPRGYCHLGRRGGYVVGGGPGAPSRPGCICSRFQ